MTAAIVDFKSYSIGKFEVPDRSEGRFTAPHSDVEVGHKKSKAYSDMKRRAARDKSIASLLRSIRYCAYFDGVTSAHFQIPDGYFGGARQQERKKKIPRPHNPGRHRAGISQQANLFAKESSSPVVLLSHEKVGPWSWLGSFLLWQAGASLVDRGGPLCTPRPGFSVCLVPFLGGTAGQAPGLAPPALPFQDANQSLSPIIVQLPALPNSDHIREGE